MRSAAFASRSRTRGWRTGDWTDTGHHHLAFRQVTVAHDALVTVRSLQISMLAEKVRDLGFDRLGQQSTRPIAEDFGELIVDVSWLNQLDGLLPVSWTPR
jgi:hypothetical protein